MCPVAICGCSEPPLLAETRDIELSGWESAESAVFHWDIQDTLQRHDVLLDVRHSQTFPYSNLFVFLTYRFPNGKSRVDTVECTLADDDRNDDTGTGKLALYRKAYEQILCGARKGP